MADADPPAWRAAGDDPVFRWLLDADPAIRWQVLADLLGAPADLVAAERARVVTEGWGARVLAAQAADGRWGGTAWNRGWDSTMHALMSLRDFGADPESEPVRRAIALVRDHVQWWDGRYGDRPFFAGESEPCINGQAAAAGAALGADVSPIIDRLLGEQLPDGGWNCEAENGSARSSFNTTICVLEALLAHERATGSDPAVAAASARGERWLVDRRMFRRRSTGEPITRDRRGGGDFTAPAFPTWWHYDVLRGLDYLRAAGVAPDDRVADAVELVRDWRGSDGRWPLAASWPGAMLVDLGETVGQPSRWVTLRALRVLRWAGDQLGQASVA
jgi:hypothetical protein